MVAVGSTRRFIGRTTALLLLGAVFAAPASAAAPWLAAVDLSPAGGTTTSTPDVAVARDGTAIAVYLRSDGGNVVASAAVRPPGGTFGAPTNLSLAGADAVDARVAVDRQGNATAIWRRSGAVESMYRPAGGAWKSRQTLSAAGASSSSLGVGDNGAATVVFLVSNVVQVASRSAGSETFGLPATSVSAAGTIRGTPRAAMDAAGDATVLWNREYDVGGGTFRRVMESIAKPVGGAFESVRTLSATTGDAGTATYIPFLMFYIYTVPYDLVMAPDGRAFATWDFTDGVNPQRVEYRERTPTTTWATTKTLSNLGVASTDPKVAADERGGIFATWSADSTVQSSVRPDVSSAFTPIRPLSGAGASPSSSSIGAGPNGEAVIIWTANPSGDPSLFSARRRAEGGEFGDVVEVARGSGITPTASFSTPRVELDDQGNGAASWVRSSNPGSGTVYTPQVAVYDPVPPALSGVAVPGSAVAGTPVGVSASASDRTGAPALSWAFGDGTAADGGAPTHTYAAAGAFTVTVTATDAAGNKASTTRLIQVTAPPVTPPPAPGDVDKDGDGVPARLDCNDGDAKIKPGAAEVRGNKVDENCDGRTDPYTTVGMSTSLSWDRLRKGSTRIKALKVERLLKGDVVSLTCATKKRGCRKAATRKTTVKKGTSISFNTYVKGMTLSPNATLVVKVTRTNAISRIVTYKMVRKKDPSKRTRCQDPGAKPTKAC